MKHLYLFAVCTLITLGLSAQITITSATHTPLVGDSYAYTVASNQTLNIHQQMGANQTWDLSTVTGSTTIAEYVSPSQASQPNAFPNATLTEKIDVVENYFSKTNDALLLEGSIISGVGRVEYSINKREQMVFPMTFGTTDSAAFEGEFINNAAGGQTFQRAGTIDFEADGYGQLILPYDTIENVLRVRQIVNYSDNFSGINVFNYTDTIYMWYNAHNNTFIANYSVSYANGLYLGSSIIYMQQNDLATGIASNDAHMNTITSYPNPASDYLIIQNEGSAVQWSLFDCRGQLVRTAMAQRGTTNIPLHELEPGMYLLRYHNEAGSYNEKIMVQ